MTNPKRTRIFTPLVIFHIRVGARLALRRLGPVLAAFFLSFYFLRAEFFFLVVSELGRSGGAALGATSALILVLIARWAAPRILLGQTGWLRGLPAPESAKRRASLAGLWISLLPVILVIGFLHVLAESGSGAVRPGYLIGLPVSGWAAGLAVLALDRGWFIRPAAFLAAVFAASGSWLFLAVGFALVIGLDRAAGPPAKSGPRRLSLFPRKVPGFHVLILLRALRWRWLGPYLAAVPPFLLTFAFLVNNAVTSLQLSRARIFGFAMALVIFHGAAAAAISSRRPPWPWLRSLPTSPRRRIISDSAFLTGASAVFLLPLLTLNPVSFAVIGLSLPALSLGAAAAMRTAPLRKASSLGVVLLYGSLGATVLSLFPPACLAMAAACPALLAVGVRLERAQKVSRWLELHHLAAGDPHSWSGR